MNNQEQTITKEQFELKLATEVIANLQMTIIRQQSTIVELQQMVQKLQPTAEAKE